MRDVNTGIKKGVVLEISFKGFICCRLIAQVVYKFDLHVIYC